MAQCVICRFVVTYTMLGVLACLVFLLYSAEFHVLEAMECPFMKKLMIASQLLGKQLFHNYYVDMMPKYYF